MTCLDTPLMDLKREEEKLRNDLDGVQRDIKEEDDIKEKAKLLETEAQAQLKLAALTAELALRGAKEEGGDPERIKKLQSDWELETLRYEVHLGKLTNPSDPDLQKKQDNIDRLLKAEVGGA